MKTSANEQVSRQRAPRSFLLTAQPYLSESRKATDCIESVHRRILHKEEYVWHIKHVRHNHQCYAPYQAQGRMKVTILYNLFSQKKKWIRLRLVEQKLIEGNEKIYRISLHWWLLYEVYLCTILLWFFLIWWWLLLLLVHLRTGRRLGRRVRFFCMFFFVNNIQRYTVDNNRLLIMIMSQ